MPGQAESGSGESHLAVIVVFIHTRPHRLQDSTIRGGPPMCLIRDGP